LDWPILGQVGIGLKIIGNVNYQVGYDAKTIQSNETEKADKIFVVSTPNAVI